MNGYLSLCLAPFYRLPFTSVDDCGIFMGGVGDVLQAVAHLFVSVSD